jgi:hypothetical protein
MCGIMVSFRSIPNIFTVSAARSEDSFSMEMECGFGDAEIAKKLMSGRGYVVNMTKLLRFSSL